ncbi:2-amino-4-hydroxy-6-hydroxymethyldihydropteridine diphosphokinase [Blastopirellula marina]|uniref:2-amino-4-hydroxy-6-hydroxymethyldihydropteridine pyrophosphokinase n=1 Tax=Blastopirellula marina TaxID=124 RepID=A0A2S8GVC8_9BACT|nr:2-amino-4-hydroxy-6-hydroxymethyldihydropteridine diphosphokinase [Blastopirellula marina]PQO35203.1 2-amino-4-hydroxy-6-hydroxymethyldihydropteridine diphosphokinase [Blastopirellula marina]PQO47994.1 2-amino-4-hydroxy-6-hydroxymethyldihydropteridine diphosphokinase [Blastopirellula marina]PTL43952.1 2-amino-4-hydroxy-6-hydroxymethyldihydropteridine diphosphokinase [Blastopirellula marina]
MPECLIALGANLGDRRQTLDGAAAMLRQTSGIDRLQVSRYHGTQPVGGPDGQPEFLNAAARFSTTLSPEEVHARLIEIEEEHGRVRLERWGARQLDLDLLLYDDRLIATDALEVPHPRMTFRRFVMEPAVEVAADMIHPICQRSLGELLRQLGAGEPAVRIVAPPAVNVDALIARVRQEVDFPLERDEEGATSAPPRLLVFWQTPPDMTDQRRPHGPYLPIPAADLDAAALEITAAIAAMSPT